MSTATEVADQAAEAQAAPAPQRPEQPKDAAGWKARAVHYATLPSGTIVSFTLPNIAYLIKTGKMPNPLVDSAIKLQNAKQVTREILEDTWDFAEWVIPEMVRAPSIDDADLPELPAEDIEMLAAFANRSIDTDAVGHQLGGLETVKSFREARGIFTSDENLLGSEGG